MMRRKRLACFIKRAQHILDANAHKNLDAEAISNAMSYLSFK